GACATGAPGGVVGDGRINVPAALGTYPAAIANESALAFTHMATADLISGVDITAGTVNFGSGLPEANIDGGFWVGYTQVGAATGVAAPNLLRPGHYLVLNQLEADVGANNGVTTSQAGRVDRKLDDGSPLTGDVRGTGTGCSVVVGGATIYDESADTNANCSLYIRVQG
ncbi:MAG TPA: hypothetical protein PLK85_07275, partial [Alphaproteobacteria bacterium]|nr:hypothetical protein [Alphaproteobacteria bacterium]